MVSLFEVYDPFIYIFNLSLNWMMSSLILFTVSLNFWSFSNNLNLLSKVIYMFIFKEFSMFFVYSFFKSGSMVLLVSLFCFILNFNLMGLLPYVFSCSSHLVFTLALSLPAWVGVMTLGWAKFINKMLCHLIPSGTPLVLIPLMVGVELVSLMIRPISLSVRLMSNMISGHLLMSLLGNCGTSLIVIQLIFLLFELFVCFIQAYVFSGLLSLYGGEI